MGTILQKLKDQLKDADIDTAGIQTISQALRKMDPQRVTGDTISECLDNLVIIAKEPDADLIPDPIDEDDEQ